MTIVAREQQEHNDANHPTQTAVALAQRVNRERIVLISWGRAVLLQLAHPLVAAGVAEHSRFRQSPAAFLARTQRTVAAMLAFTFGPPAAAEQAARRINRIHDRVCGTLAEPAGPYPAGTPYSAHDPALLAWVHATLVESVVLAYEALITSLTPVERDQYCQASQVMERWLHAPPGTFPSTWDALRHYLASMVTSGQVAVSETARILARHLLWPPLSPALQPAAALLRLITIGWLPAPIREAYGFPFSAQQAHLLRLLTALLRRSLPAWPSKLRHWPIEADPDMAWLVLACPWHA